MTLGDILFDVDQATLKPGAMQNLFRLVTFLKQYPDRGVLVEGHTDSTGSDTYNLSLSEQRAESVRSFLTQNGIGAARVLARGYGKAYPVAGNDTSAGRQRNRRVDLVILRAGESPERSLRPAAP
jgi:outer membrane protein OmpA-like peptidoglycan-associated protein